MSECEICMEEMNKSSRKEINCPYCNYGCCKSCFRKYLLSQDTPNCMKCKKSISLEFISSVTPKCFYNKEYRDCRAKVLLSREKSLLPQAQELVQERLEEQRRGEKLKIIKKKENELLHQLYMVRREMWQINNPGRKKKKEATKFIMGCTNGECRGFLSKAWKCGTCEKYICPDCHGVKIGRDDPDHVCKKEDIETAKLLSKDTKNCPNCAVRIFKISGCDQMWCVECKTAFSWKTGKIETSHIHNPHYYQWQRDMNNGVAPRVPGDIPGNCNDRNDLPWVGVLHTIFNNSKRNVEFEDWRKCHRSVVHIERVTLQRYHRRNLLTDNIDLRADFLMNYIDEKEWLKTLKRRQKGSEMKNDIRQVLEMYINSMKDIFNTFVTGKLKEIEKPACSLKNYVNNELQKISSRYGGNKVPHIRDDWSVYD